MTRLTNRSAAVAVGIAFSAGLLASLAIRPSGGGSPVAGPTETGTVSPQLRWRVPIAFATNLPVLGDNILYVQNAVETASGGRIVMQLFEPGEIVPPFNIVDAVREGKVPAGYTWLGYDQGKIPASTLIAAVPFGMAPWEFSAWWFDAGGREQAERLYAKYDVHPLYCGLIGPETAGWFRDPIESLDDIAGLKIRFAGLGGKVIEQLGASVTMIPGGEIFQALEKGAIDASEYSLPIVDEALGFDRIAKINYFPGWHQPFSAVHLAVNKPVWDGLDPFQRGVFETACTAGVTRNLARSEAVQGPVLASFDSRGVSTLQLPETVLRELERVTRTVLAEEAEKDEDFRAIYAAQREFRKAYARWKQLAYLPRDF